MDQWRSHGAAQSPPELQSKRNRWWLEFREHTVTDVDVLPAVEFLLDKMKDTKTNSVFFDAMKR